MARQMGLLRVFADDAVTEGLTDIRDRRSTSRPVKTGDDTVKGSSWGVGLRISPACLSDCGSQQDVEHRGVAEMP